MTVGTYLVFVAPVALVLLGLLTVAAATLIIRSGRVDEVALRRAAHERDRQAHVDQVGRAFMSGAVATGLQGGVMRAAATGRFAGGLVNPPIRDKAAG